MPMVSPAKTNRPGMTHEPWKIRGATMSKKASHSKNFSYPAATTGSEAAKRLRAEANKLSKQQREDLFKRGMQIIYGR